MFLEFTCHLYPEVGVNFPCLVFSSTFIHAFILKSHMADNQCVVVTKLHSILGPVDTYWRITPHNTLCRKRGV